MFKFSIRDVFWLVAVFVSASLAAMGGYSMASARGKTENYSLKWKLQLYTVRLNQLKKALTEAGVAIPEPDDEEPYPP